MRTVPHLSEKNWCECKSSGLTIEKGRLVRSGGPVEVKRCKFCSENWASLRIKSEKLKETK